jgi:hypothetical protein
MISNSRKEYHWIENRTIEKIVCRPENAKRWPFDVKNPTLVAVIEPRDNSFELRYGPARTDSRVVDAVRHYQGLYTDEKIADFGKDLTTSFIERTARRIKGIINEYTNQYNSFANEEDITGFIKGQLGNFEFEDDNTRVLIKTWTYARNPKERKLGLDIGVIFDILRGNQRVVKAIWIQAKRSEAQPEDILELPDLKGQLKDMQCYTNEAYALVYTPVGAEMYRADAPKMSIPVEDVMSESLNCKRGDRTPVVVALTGDSKLLIDVLVTIKS